MKFRYLHVDEDGDVSGTNDPVLANKIAGWGYPVYDAENGRRIDIDAAIQEIDADEWNADAEEEEEEEDEEDDK